MLRQVSFRLRLLAPGGFGYVPAIPARHRPLSGLLLVLKAPRKRVRMTLLGPVGSTPYSHLLVFPANTIGYVGVWQRWSDDESCS